MKSISTFGKLLTALLLFGQFAFAQTVQVGTGTSTNSNSPINSCYDYSYAEMIYDQSEIATAGTIEKVRFYYAGGGDPTVADDLIEVYLGHTTATGFTGTTAWIGAGGMTQVFSGSISYPGAGNWLEITLTTPFVYNNTDNLVVGVLQNEAGWSCSVSWQYTTSAGNKNIYHRHDGGSIIDPFSPPTANGVNSVRPNIQLAFQEPCPGPSAGGASNVTYNSADVSWGAASSAPSNGYDWEVRSSGVGGSGGAGLAASGNTAGLTASTGVTLAGETTYTIYVRSNCGGTGTSSWATAGSFTTPCAPVTAIPYTEPFDTYSGSVMPNCWEEGDNGDLTAGPATRGGATASAEWYNNPFPGTGSNSFTCNIWATGMNDWYLSPGFTIPATPDHRLTYDIAATDYNSSDPVTGWEPDDFVEFLVSTDGQTNWTVLETYNDGNVPSNTGQNEIFSLNAYAGSTVYFAFRCVEGAANGSADWEVYMDNFVVEEVPSCEDPTVTAATGIGSDIATLNWTASTSDPADGYLWEVRTSGAGGSGATGLVTSGTVGYGVTTASTGNTLAAGTTYNVYVQSDCGGGTTSGWDGPISFTTAYAAPYCDATGLAIPDNQCGSNELEVLIDVTSTGTALGTDVFMNEVGITIDHTWDGDLTITLESPAGTSLLLSDGNGGSADDYGDPTGVACPSVTGYTAFGTVGTAITGGTAPYNDQVYTPEGAGGLSAFTGEDPNGVWKLTVCDGGGGDTGDLLYFNVGLTTCPSPAVTAATNVAQTTADVNWNESSPAAGSGYQWEVRTSGAGGSGATGLVDNGSVAAGITTDGATGLTANTTYQVYVRSNCGGSFSDWVGPLAFTTACDPGAIPFFEGFESDQTNGTDVVNCWEQESLGGTQTWTANDTETSFNRSPRTGSFNAYLRYGNEDWLFYALALTGGQSYTFDVYARQDGSDDTDASITLSYGTAPGDAAMTGNTIVNQQGITNGAYQLIQGAFTPPANGTYYIGVKGEMNFSPFYISIDDINVYETPLCQAPANGVVDAVGASNVEFSWDASPSAPANGYNYEVRSTGTGGAGSVGLDIEGSVAAGVLTADSDDGTINTPLAPGTSYDIYVQANCGTGNTSPWIGPITFTTPYANPFCTGTGLAIPDNGCGSSTFAELAVVHSGGTAIGTDIFLEGTSITIDHTWSGDLDIYLVSPAGTSVTLSEGNGGSTDDYGDAPINCGSIDPTIFQDAASTAITAGSAPFIGTFSPEGNLSDFDGEDPNGIWTLRVCDGGGGDLGEIQYFSVDFVTCIAPAVNAPSALASTSATIDWDAAGGASSYNWEIRDDNSDGGSGATGLVNSGSTASTDAPSGALTANTTYYVWVQTDCGGGDLSSWAGPVAFTTPCDPGTIPFFDGFESNQTNGTDVADCWSQESVVGTQTWTANNSLTSFNRAPRTGSYNAYLRYSNEDWIYYPLALTGGTSYTAEAFARQDGGTATNASLTIKWGSVASAGAMTGNVAGADNVGLVNGSYQLVQGTFTPSVNGTYYIGIKGDINGSPWYISLDDISVYETPSCLPPDITDVTNVTGTSVTVNWDASVSLPADGYEWEIRSSGAGGSGATGLEASGSTAAGVLTANSGAVLTAGSQYTLYVRSICSTSPSVSSTWNDYLFSTVENDLCANAIEIPCGTSNLAGSTDNVVSQAVTVGCAQNPYGVWYKVTGDDTETTIDVTTTAYDIEVGVASGSCGSLTNIDCQDGVVNGTESITFIASSGTDYYIYISYWATGGTTTGDFTISRTCAPAPIPPVNDDCADARLLNCLTLYNGTTDGAVAETAPGTCGVSDYGVWYTFPGDGQQTTITCDAGAGFDHELAIMSGSCGSFTTIDCIDDGLSGGTEEYTFVTTIGVDYYVYVAYWSSFGDSDDAGTFSILRTCQAPPPVPANDECAGAINLDCGDLVNGTTVGCEDETVPTCGMSEKNVWYTFVGNGFPTTITVTPIAGFDLEVGYGTGSCGSVTNFFCDDATVSTPETHTFNTVFGTTYYVYVGHWSSFSTGVTGSFTIERSCSGLAVWNGETSTDWNTATNWTPNAVPLSTEDAYIPGNPSGGNFPVINADVEIDEIIIEAGGNVEILGGSSLTVTGDIRNDGTVQVNSEGSLVQTTGSTLTSASGTYVVKRDGSPAYDYWSSPITSSPVIGGSYQYNPGTGTVDPADDEFDPGWVAAAGTMTPGRGYAAYGILTRAFAGEVNNGNVSIGVSANPAPNVSWNLIGNPYPSGLDVLQFLSTNSGQLAAPAVYLWDDPGTQPYGVGDYAVRNAGGGTAGGGGNTPGPVLATAQGFKVNVNSTGNIQFTNAMRSTGNSSVLFRQSESKRLWLNVTHPDGFFNQTLVGFYEQGTAGLDIFDAPKLNWMSDLSLYSILNDEPYSIQGYGPFYPEAVFPLGIHLGALNGMDITFEIDHVDGLEDNDIYLEDTYLGVFHDLNTGAYTFTGTQGVTNDRFFVHFSTQSVTSIRENEGSATFGAVMNNETLVVSSRDDLEGDLEILDMSGRVIFTRGNVLLNTEGTRIDMSNVSDGIYIVRFVGAEGTQSKKVLK